MGPGRVLCPLRGDVGGHQDGPGGSWQDLPPGRRGTHRPRRRPDPRRSSLAPGDQEELLWPHLPLLQEIVVLAYIWL